MSSQYGEHLTILKYFEGRPGRFLDVGAGDGLTYSNTEPLLRAGWSGVMVEPAISQLRWLIENHQDNPKVEIIPAALTRENGIRTVHDARNFSTCLSDFRQRIETCYRGEFGYRARVGVTLTWEDMGRAGYQFVNIDVEGMNTEVLAWLPFERIQPEMVCIEIDPEEALPRMMDILAQNGLSYAKRVGGNLLAARKEIL